MKLDSKSTEARNYLLGVMTVLEKIKTDNPENESLRSNVVAQAYVEDQAQRLFDYAEAQDHQAIYNQKVVQAFYTAGYLFEVLTAFGEVDENIQSAKKYSQWRATHIHQCLKSGETPTPGQKRQPSESEGFDVVQKEDGSAEYAAWVAGMNINAPVSPPLPVVPQPPAGGYGYGQQHEPKGPHPQTTQFPVYPSNPPPQQNSHQYPGIQPTASQAGGGANAYGVHGYGQQPMGNTSSAPAPIVSAAAISMEEYIEAKKLVKYAMSALDYEDSKTAIENMYQAIAILQKQKPT